MADRGIGASKVIRGRRVSGIDSGDVDKALAECGSDGVQRPMDGLTSGGLVSRRGFLAVMGAAAGMLAVSSLAGCSNGSGSDADSNSGSDGSSSASGSSEYDEQSIVLFLFDTVIEISALCSEELMSAVSDRLEYFESIFSRTVEGSDIWNINEAAGEPVEVNAETADVIGKSIGYSEASDGLFDITIGTVTVLWDFDEGVKPDDDVLAEAVKHVGYGNISVDGTTVQLSDPDTKLDLGGVAKGYICDDIVQMFLDGGCESASISLGGNVYVIGSSFDGDSWVVGVQDPNGTYDESIAKLEASDMSVVTSGLYERYFVEDGVTYYHILDPKTGYPVETDLESASLVSESSTDGDAYATILFLMGHDAAMDLIESDDRFQGLLIDSDGNISTSEGSDFELL